MDFGIQGKVALVLASSRGLGQAMAVSLAREGVKVAVSGRNPEGLNTTVEMIQSSGAIAPIRNLAISNTLRAGLSAWSKTLANEVAGEGITANIIMPGRVATDRLRQLDEARAKRENMPYDAVVEASLKLIPAGRYGDPKEYGDTAAFLASMNAAYITGSVIRVDGGQLQSF